MSTLSMTNSLCTQARSNRSSRRRWRLPPRRRPRFRPHHRHRLQPQPRRCRRHRRLPYPRQRRVRRRPSRRQLHLLRLHLLRRRAHRRLLRPVNRHQVLLRRSRQARVTRRRRPIRPQARPADRHLMGPHLVVRLPAERLRHRSGETRVFARDKPVTSPPGSRPGTDPRAGSAIESALRGCRCFDPCDTASADISGCARGGGRTDRGQLCGRRDRDTARGAPGQAEAQPTPARAVADRCGPGAAAAERIAMHGLRVFQPGPAHVPVLNTVLSRARPPRGILRPTRDHELRDAAQLLLDVN
jgi:hypothetical protein